MQQTGTKSLHRFHMLILITTLQKREKLASIMATFEDAVVDNIIYEENRQPDEVVGPA